eukprot:4865604-Amphidinium_carterae.1
MTRDPCASTLDSSSLSECNFTGVWARRLTVNYVESLANKVSSHIPVIQRLLLERVLLLGRFFATSLMVVTAPQVGSAGRPAHKPSEQPAHHTLLSSCPQS